MVKIKILEHKKHKFMWLDEYLWMWDTPQEQNLQKELAKKSFGDVLVAGYGFGILQKYLFKNKKVKSIITIEKYREVLDEIKRTDILYGKIIVEDFYKISENKKFDCVIGDIWPDISKQFLNDYIKFKNKANKILKKNGKIIAWGQDYFEYLIAKN